jgi:hypothetical protein
VLWPDENDVGYNKSVTYWSDKCTVKFLKVKTYNSMVDRQQGAGQDILKIVPPNILLESIVQLLVKKVGKRL